MKLVILSALLIGCVTSASAETKMMGGCELTRIKGSNAYYFSDAECAVGSGAVSAKARVALRVTPAKPIPANIEKLLQTSNTIPIKDIGFIISRICY